MTKKSDDLTFNYFDMFVFCKQCRKMQIENLEDFGTSLSEFIEKFTCNTCSPRYEHELKKRGIKPGDTQVLCLPKNKTDPARRRTPAQ